MRNLCIVWVLVLLPGIASADFSIGAKAGTIGAGLEGIYHFDDQFALRGTVGSYTYSNSREISGINYDYDLGLTAGGVLLDIFPKGKRFYFTGGVLLNASVFDADAIIVDTIDVGGTTYTAADVGELSGELEFQPITPYIGMGWRWRNNKPGLSIGVEAGLIFQGKGDIAITATGPIADTPGFQTDVLAEIDEIEDQLGIAKLFPVLEARLVYRFK